MKSNFKSKCYYKENLREIEHGFMESKLALLLHGLCLALCMFLLTLPCVSPFLASALSGAGELGGGDLLAL